MRETMPKPVPWPNGCPHTTCEHWAFDHGVEAGRVGATIKDNSYKRKNLADAWATGHSVGALDFQEGEESGG